MESKPCTKCSSVKPLTDFYKKKSMKLGVDSWCKVCKNKDRTNYKRWEGYREAGLEYYRNNKEVWRGIKAKRRAAQLNARPSWADSEWETFAVKETYKLAYLRSSCTGVAHEVDHIIPLTNSKVCGLHVAANLQVLTQTANRSKSNKYVGGSCEL